MISTKPGKPAAVKAAKNTRYEPSAPHEQQREFMSFLTWPFVMAQALAAEEVLDGAMKSAAAGEDIQYSARLGQNDALGSGDDAAAQNWASRKSADDDQHDQSTDARARDLPDARSDKAETKHAPERADEAAAHDKEASLAAPGASGSGGGAARSGGADANDASGDVGTIVQQIDGTLVNDALGPIDDALGPINDALAPSVDTATKLVGDGVGIASGVLQAPVALLGASAPLIDAVTSAAKSELPAVAAVVEVGSDFLETAQASQSNGLLASGGVIAFSDGKAIQLHTDDLFVDGSHTDYGLALRTAVAESAAPLGDAIGHAAHDVPNVTLATDGSRDQHSTNDGDHSPHTLTSVTVELATTLDEAAIRGHDSMM
jgi:hypothetical protein